MGVAFAAGAAGPPLAGAAYRLWNRLAQRFARIAQAYVLVVCYVLVVLPASRAGSRMRLDSGSATTSAWQPRSTLPAEAYASMYAGVEQTPRTRGWLSDLLRWSTYRGEWWIWAIVPFMALLRALSSSRTEAAPESVYTLY